MTDGFVAFSEIGIDPIGSDRLVEAFTQRLGAVDTWPGFRRLEVWEDEAASGRFVMVSWWDDKESFKSYMRSEDHRLSHARIPSDPAAPRPVSFSRFRIIAD